MINLGVETFKNIQTEIVGLMPAGGKGNRIAPLPFSKELYPVGFHDANEDLGLRPKVVSHYLLEKMRLAGITNVYIILRKGKWDIPAYFGDGKILKMNLAYLMMDLPFGVPYSVDQAYPFVKDAVVILGFPDIIFQPEDAFSQALTKLSNTNADIVLGLSPVEKPQNWDMVDLTEDGRVHRIYIKQPRINLPYGWFIAVWTPVFTNFMHQDLITHQREIRGQEAAQNLQTQNRELYMGEVFQLAIKEGLSIETVIFTEGSCIDIGTPEDLMKALDSRK